MMRILSAAAFIALMSGGALAQSPGPPWHDPSRCSQQDVMKADEAVDHLKSWTAVHRVFRQYGKCDDGGIAEGYSDAVAKLLAWHWASLNELTRLTQKDPLFERFVLAHVDQTIGLDEGKAIIVNARDQCPAGAQSLCRRLGKAARAAQSR